MSKKLTMVTLAMFAVGLVGPAALGQNDPSLVGWWKFDGDGLDASGNAHNGVAMGDAHFEPGHDGQALALDGDADYFTVTGWKGLMSSSPVTVTAWVRTTGNGTMVYWGRNNNGRRVDFRINAGRLRVEQGGGNLQADTVFNDGEWHHVALAMGANVPISYPQVKLYLDGRDDTRNTQDPGLFNLVTHNNNVDVAFGYRPPQADRFLVGLLDEVRIYERVLAAEEIKDVFRYGYFASAHSPSIPNGSRFEEFWTVLKWARGPLATSFNVYFGTSFEDVDAGAASVFVGNVVGDSQPVGVAGYPAAEGLKPGTTYYWRVDAVKEGHPDSPWRGEVWSFQVPDLAAYEPFPADGDPCEDPNVDLSWAWGLKAIVGTVYFGTDANQVAGATDGLPQTASTYDPGPLQRDATYYWRADTFNGKDWINGPVWSFKTEPAIPVTEPNLICWWRFDEGAGTRVLDHSGHGHAGRFNGAPQWVDGCDGGALSVDGHDDSVLYELPQVQGFARFTVAVWVKAAVLAQGGGMSVFTTHSPSGLGAMIDVDGTNPGNYRLNPPAGTTYGRLGPVVLDWVHLAAVAEGTTVQGYYNGAWAFSYTITEPNDLLFNEFLIGTNRNRRNFFAGAVDDFRMYDRALTEQELQRVMRIDPLLAWSPSPAVGTVADIRSAAPLTWKAGDGATKHNVYLGTDPNVVAGADASDITGIYRGQRSTTTYTPAEGLAWGQQYFWRVDEVGAGGAVVKGRLWSFTVADYLIVDDFESYTNDSPNKIFQTWIDGVGFSEDAHFPMANLGNGTRATVGHDIWTDTSPYYNLMLVERATTYDGGQAMPLYYDNATSPYYADAERTWTTGQDWTVHGVDTLTLYFTAGALADVTAQGLSPLYVGVQDTAGGLALVPHSNPEAVRQVQWQRWDIPLADLRVAGVNPATVKKMFIRVGNRTAATPDGTGRIFIDAIRLTKSQATGGQ